MSQDLLMVEGVSLSFGGLRAVSDFALRVPERALYGLIGPNGAGKTTVFNLLTGVYKPDAGTIRLGSQDLHGLRPNQIAKAGVGRTFQNIRLFGELSVQDNVRLGFHAHSKSTTLAALLRTTAWKREEDDISRKSLELLELFGLADRQHEIARNLPYGDQRRLEIARALALSPRLLLLDEPAAGMNPQEKNELRALIDVVRERFGVAVLLIEHDMGVVMGLCQHITVLDHGEIIATGTAHDIQHNPRVIEAYLGAEVHPKDEAPTAQPGGEA